MATAQFNKDQQILLCTPDNPRGDNTKRGLAFSLYTRCRTVGEFLAAGGRRRDIIRDSSIGLIILDWEQAKGPATEGVESTAMRVTSVRNGVRRSKPAEGAPISADRKVENFFKANEAAKLAGAIAAKSGVSMENLIVRVVK